MRICFGFTDSSRGLSITNRSLSRGAGPQGVLEQPALDQPAHGSVQDNAHSGRKPRVSVPLLKRSMIQNVLGTAKLWKGVEETTTHIGN